MQAITVSSFTIWNHLAGRRRMGTRKDERLCDKLKLTTVPNSLPYLTRWLTSINSFHNMCSGIDLNLEYCMLALRDLQFMLYLAQYRLI